MRQRMVRRSAAGEPICVGAGGGGASAGGASAAGGSGAGEPAASAAGGGASAAGASVGEPGCIGAGGGSSPGSGSGSRSSATRRPVSESHSSFTVSGVLLLAAVDGQDAVRRDVADRLLELEIVLVILPLPFGQFFALGRGQSCRCPTAPPGPRRARRPTRRSARRGCAGRRPARLPAWSAPSRG